MTHTLLIVEDDTFLIRAYQTQFEGGEYTLLFANDGEQAKAIVEGQTVDAIVLDLVMPQKSGLDFLQYIRSNAKLEKIPVIVATNMSAPNEKDQCEKLGISDYCIKSDVSIDQIVQKVKKALEK